MNWDRIHTIVLTFTLAFILAMLLMVDRPIHAQVPHGTASEEVPRGTIDGVNTTFTLNFQPAPWGSIHVYVNGARRQRHVDYELTGPNHTLIVFQPSPLVPSGIPNLDGPDNPARQWQGALIRPWGSGIPQPGDIVLADYTY